MRYVEINESYNLNEFLGFGKKKEKPVAKGPVAQPAVAQPPVDKPVAKDPLQQQWDSAKANTNAMLKDINANDTELRQFASDMKDFAQATDEAFGYISDPRAFNHVARTAAQKYVMLNQKYFSKNKSAPRADGAASNLSMQGQEIYANINKELLPFFKALQKRIT